MSKVGNKFKFFGKSRLVIAVESMAIGILAASATRAVAGTVN